VASVKVWSQLSRATKVVLVQGQHTGGFDEATFVAFLDNRREPMSRTQAAKSPDHQTGRHGDAMRGLNNTVTSPATEGRFGRLFPNLPAAQFGSSPEKNTANLRKLGLAMSAAFDPPKDGKDEEESGIPALYTYFGQFVDHDITFDPSSSLQKQNDPDALIDYRTPALDLDNIYGRGPSDQPYLYTEGCDQSKASHFLLGVPIYGGNAGARDLSRNNADPARAII
jgi:hypothetical protein